MAAWLCVAGTSKVFDRSELAGASSSIDAPLPATQFRSLKLQLARCKLASAEEIEDENMDCNDIEFRFNEQQALLNHVGARATVRSRGSQQWPKAGQVCCMARHAPSN